MLFSEVVRGVFDEKDHWENRTVTHIHKSSHRLRKSSGRRRRTISASETIDDPDLTDDPHSVAATSIAATALTSQPSEKRTHRRALSERDSQHAETIGLGTIPSVFSGDIEAEIAELRRQASAAAGQQHKYQEVSVCQSFHTLVSVCLSLPVWHRSRNMNMLEETKRAPYNLHVSSCLKRRSVVLNFE
jgi:hypothetical protein